MTNTIIAIPARMASTRLPGKPLADIHGKPMIVRVWERAVAAEAGRVLVATDSDEIASAVSAFGGEAILTRSDHASGSDRCYEAITKVDPDRSADLVVNLQGDLPTLEPRLVSACLAPLRSAGADIATLGSVIVDEREKTSPDVVKIVATPLGTGTGSPATRRSGEAEPETLRALYFTRATAPHGPGPLYHHIGIYAYRRPALERFVGLPPSPLERRERLEQLRALENGFRIDVTIVDTVPIGVDTQADLDRVRGLLG